MGEEYAFTNFTFLFRARHSCLVLVSDNEEQRRLARGGTLMGLSGGECASRFCFASWFHVLHSRGGDFTFCSCSIYSFLQAEVDVSCAREASEYFIARQSCAGAHLRSSAHLFHIFLLSNYYSWSSVVK